MNDIFLDIVIFTNALDVSFANIQKNKLKHNYIMKQSVLMINSMTNRLSGIVLMKQIEFVVQIRYEQRDVVECLCPIECTSQ